MPRPLTRPIYLTRPLFLAVLSLGIYTSSLSGQVPSAAAKYHATIVRETHAVWGLSGQPAVFASQIAQESGFNSNAHSGVGAVGLSQFMPSTSQFISATYPQQLGGPAPLDPNWAIRALVYYDHWIYVRLPMYQETGNNRLAASLSGFNAGLGWVQRAFRNAVGCDGSLWWGCAENSPDGRTEANREQSKQYPRKILLYWLPKFIAAGW